MPAKKSKKTSVTSKKETVSYATLSREELATEIATAHRDLFALRMKHSIGELKQPHLIRAKRRMIAQMSTSISA